MGRSATFAAGILLSALACGPGDEGNQPPVADAGPDRTFPFGRLVVLNGVCTDPDPEDRGRLEYRWTLHTVPEGSARVQEDVGGVDGPDVWMEVDRPGVYVLGLACRDPHAWGEEDLVTVTVEAPPPNRPPTVDAGADLEVELGTLVRLDGRAFDPDGDPVVWQWTLQEVPGDSSLSSGDLVGAAGPAVRFVPDVVGTYRLDVVVDDGRGGQAEDSLHVTVVAPETLDGVLTVTVVDGRSLEPIEGARVAIDDRLLDDLTGADGRVSFARGWLTGPVDVTVAGPGTVTWRHDGERSTDPITEPRWRMQTWTQVDRPSIVVALEPTAGGRAAADVGRVWGSVPWQVFETLPEIAQMYSIAGAEISGQLRLVMVTPVLPLDWLAEPVIQDVLAPAPAQSATVTLPGNLTSDDAFLHDVAGLIGRFNGPSGQPPFSMFEIPMPAGPGHVALLGGIASGDLAQLLPALLRPSATGHLQNEFGYLIGALSFTTLFVGVVAVDVPEGGQVDISDQLTDPEQWVLYEPVSYDQVRVEEEVCDAMGQCADLVRVRLFPADRVEVRTPALPPDPRVAAAVPTEGPYDLLCGGSDGMLSHCDPRRSTTLEVPGDVGTRMPYALHSLYLEVPRGDARMPEGGLVLGGFHFSGEIPASETTNVFSVPELSGSLDGLSYTAMSIAYRRFRLQRGDGKLIFREGWVTGSRTGLYPGLTVDLEAYAPKPSLVNDAGELGVEVLFDVDDPTRDDPEVRFSHVMSLDPMPGATPEVLLGAIALTPAGADVGRRRLTLAEVDRVTSGGRLLPVPLPRWDVSFPATTTELRIPLLAEGLERPLAEDAEIWSRVTDERHATTFEYPRPDPTVRRRGTAADAWSWRLSE